MIMKKMLCAAVVAFSILSLVGCGKKGPKIEPGVSGTEIKDDSVKQETLEKFLAAIDNNITKMSVNRALELEYEVTAEGVETPETHVINKYIMTKYDGTSVFNRTDAFVTLNGEEKEGHKLEYLLQGKKRKSKEIVGTADDLNKYKWVEESIDINPDEFINHTKELILSKVNFEEYILTDDADVDGEMLYEISTLIDVNEALNILGISAAGIGLDTEKTAEEKCTIDIFFDKEDFSLARIRVNLTEVLANCYKLMEEAEKQYTAGKCEYSEAFNYDDQSSKIEFTDKV